MNFTTANGKFLRGGKPWFVVSGEIHYFRLDPDLWEKHLVLLKRSGANTVSTYIPWDWHGFEEDRYDFTGETHSGRNLFGFIGLCRKVGLDLIVKPGPYILAEYELHGLPAWVLRRCSKEARAVDENGKVIADEVMSYMGGEFLRETFLWYDRIMPVIAREQCSKGGPITMMQVCNEVGVFQWLSGRLDYSGIVARLYRDFLREKFVTAAELNRCYGTSYASFDAIELPRGPIMNREEYRAYYDFHLFYRYYYALYLKTLTARIRSYGISLQLTHNIPGWIFGYAAELPMLVSTYADVLRTHGDMVFGLDHIPEFMSYRNAHSDLACNKILQSLQPGGPVWAAEFQAGTREHFVKNDPADMELFYFASLAHGLKGFNYYMFSQGENPDGKGFNGKTFYFQTPLSARAEKSPLYSVTKKYGAFIKREGARLLATTVRADVCAGLYLPYFYTELTTSQMLREPRLHVEKVGLRLDPRFVRENIFFDGLLRALQTLNISYDIRDLETTSIEVLLGYRQLWVVTTEFMDERTQLLLTEYVRRGGHLVLYPTLPALDNYLHPCTALKDGLRVKSSSSPSPRKVSAFGIEEVFSLFEEKEVFDAAAGESVATTKTGSSCGLHRNFEKGSVTALGFAFGYSTDEHLKLYQRILSLDGIRPTIRVSDPDIQYVLRRGKGFSYLFLLNYHNARKTFTVRRKKFTLPPLSYRIVPQRRRKHGVM